MNEVTESILKVYDNEYIRYCPKCGESWRQRDRFEFTFLPRRRFPPNKGEVESLIFRQLKYHVFGDIPGFDKTASTNKLIHIPIDLLYVKCNCGYDYFRLPEDFFVSDIKEIKTKILDKLDLKYRWEKTSFNTDYLVIDVPFAVGKLKED